MGTNPLATTTSSSISNSVLNNSNASKSVSFTVGDINVNTQSDDAYDIGEGVKKSLMEHFNQAVNTFDDGVRI